MCTFLFWMVHCGIWERCTVGFVRSVYCCDMVVPHMGAWSVLSQYGGFVGMEPIWAWWPLDRMMTSLNGNIFRVTGPLWRQPPTTGEFPSQRPVTRSFDVFFDVDLNRRLTKQTRRRWFETPSRSLWRHSNGPRCIRPIFIEDARTDCLKCTMRRCG